MIDLWVEKYRPRDFENYVFPNDELREAANSWVKEGIIPHVLLSGSAGTGKTTLARMLIEALDLDDYDVMYSNGSKEARKVEWIDTLIGFCQTMPFGKFKVVLIDEADYMNPNSVQPALRNLMEEYSQSVRFILTCNYPNKILPAIHSRCQQFHIDKTDLTEFTARAATVLVNEEIDFDLDTLDVYVKATYPDLRKCLNLLQPNSVSGKLKAPSELGAGSKDWRLDAVALFKKGTSASIVEARKLICTQATAEDMDGVFRWMYDNLELWSTSQEGQDAAIHIIKKGIIDHGRCTDAEINLSSILIELTTL